MEDTELIAVKDAVRISEELGQPISRFTIIYAARNGFIAGARKIGNVYTFSCKAFLDWMNDRPKPGPKPAKPEAPDAE
jgi:hypothetical protein